MSFGTHVSSPSVKVVVNSGAWLRLDLEFRSGRVRLRQHSAFGWKGCCEGVSMVLIASGRWVPCVCFVRGLAVVYMPLLQICLHDNAR